MLCALFDWNWQSDSGVMFKFLLCALPFLLISPLGKRRCTSLLYTWISFTHGYLVQNVLEIGPEVLQTKTLKIRQCIFPISLSYLLGQINGPSFAQTSIYFTQRCILSSLIKISPVVFENFIWTYKQLQMSIRKAHLSFKLRWANKNKMRKKKPNITIKSFV